MRVLVGLACALALAGCATTGVQPTAPPQLAPVTPGGAALAALQPPDEPVVVAVYDFPDLTGQNKPNEEFPEYSSAVTKGGMALLLEALLEAGDGQWFTVLERAGLDNLLQERQIIRQTREQYLGSDGEELPPPPALIYAPILLEGGIVAYETNTETGGAGARYLGIGASTEYQVDHVTVALRASSIQTGRVLVSVTATKSIYSTAAQAGVFRFVDFDELLELEAGVTRNEPPQLAVRRAIEKAVHALILKGVRKDIWTFASS